MKDDRYFMMEALHLAEKGRGFTSPNPMVGAVLVKDHRVIGKGFHEEIGGPHAEANAIDNSKEDPRNAVLYVTLEPCNHAGRTPPCTEKILSAGIRRVVTAMNDPNPRVAGGGSRYLKQRGVDVAEGVCRAEAQQLNEAFIKYVKTNRPFTTIKWASTLDGRIAAKTGNAKWITNSLSRSHVHYLRHSADAIMVGIGTVIADDPMLTTRMNGLICGKKGRNPLRIILDTRLSINETANVLNPDAQTMLAMGDLSLPSEKADKKRRLIQRGINVIELPLKQEQIDLHALMKKLGEMGIASLLIEGGSRVMTSALSEKIADKMVLFYAPKILGGNDGMPILCGKGPENISGAIRLSDMSIKRFGDDVMIQGYPVYPG